MYSGYFVRNPEGKPEEDKGKTSTTCATCGLVSQSQYGLMKHERQGCPALKPKPPTKPSPTKIFVPPLPLDVHPDEAPIGVGSVPCYLCGTFLKNAQALKKHERKTCPRRPKPEQFAIEGYEAAGPSKPKAAPPPEVGVLCANCGVYCKSEFILSKHEPHCSQKPRCGSCGLYFYKKEHRDEHERDHCEANREDDFADVFPVSSIAVKQVTKEKRKGIDLLADCPVMGRAPGAREAEDEEEEEQEEGERNEEEEPVEAKKKKVDCTLANRKFGCMFCEMVFPTPTQRSTHEVREHWDQFLRMQQENRARPRTRHFKCHGCDTRFDSFAERSAHVAKKHPIPCVDKSNPPESIKALLKGSARCPKCRKIYRSTDDRDRHIAIEHDYPSPTATVIKCYYCRKKFKSGEARDEHMKTEHTDRNYYNTVCFLCKKYFKSKEEKEEHIKDEHEGVDMPSVADIKAKYGIKTEKDSRAVGLPKRQEERNSVEHEAPDEESFDDIMSSLVDDAASTSQSTASISVYEKLVKEENDADSRMVSCVEHVVKSEPPEEEGLPHFQREDCFDWRNEPDLPHAFFTCSTCPERFRSSDEKNSHKCQRFENVVKSEPPEEEEELPYFQREDCFDWRNEPNLPHAFFTCSSCPERFRTADEKNSHICGPNGLESIVLFREASDVKPEVKEEPVDDVIEQAEVEEQKPPGSLPVATARRQGDRIPNLPLLYAQVIAALAIINSVKPSLTFQEICLFASVYFTPLYGDVPNLEDMIQRAMEMPVFSKLGGKPAKYKISESAQTWRKKFSSTVYKKMNDETLWPKMRCGRLKWDKNIVNGDSLL